jgi:FkbM family methyltransferase
MKKLWKLIQLFNLLSTRQISIRNILERNFSIASTVLLSRIRTVSSEIELIIDVGANKGQFALASRRLFPNAVIISFEPDPDTFRSLQKNIAGLHNIEVYNYALGNGLGKLPFYRNKDSQTNSILPSFSDQLVSDSFQANVINVEVKRLDQIIYPGRLEKKVLLKLDVQGYEKTVLEGCGILLDQIEFVLLEVSFRKSYQGEPSFDELNDLLKGKNFRLLAPLNFLNDGISITQADLLYHKV